MRTSKELADEVIRRLEIANREKAARRRKIYAVSATAVSLALIVVLSYFLPPALDVTPDAPNVASATLLGTAGLGGYVIVGVTGIVLGVALTLLYQWLHKKDRG